MNRLDVARREIAHFGAILSHISIITIVLTFVSFLGMILVPMLYILYYAFLIISTIFTLGLLLFADNYRSLYSLDFNVDEIVELLANSVPIFAIISIILLIVSLTCLLFDTKWKGAKSRILYICIVLGIIIIGAILILIGIIGGANQ